MYAIWDRAPEISAPDKEYFEGETVKREDLLKDGQSTDQEDGELTAQIKIVQIEYAPGRLTEDGKADKEVKTWKDGMSSEELLDTWFLQLDKKSARSRIKSYIRLRTALEILQKSPAVLRLNIMNFR
ncbi:MAG: hypothetical protein ACLUJR_09445 [Mediterraneibacter gnavus]